MTSTGGGLPPTTRYLKFGSPHVGPDMPRDYSPVAEAPALRELIVLFCPPVETEVAAIVAGLPPWETEEDEDEDSEVDDPGGGGEGGTAVKHKPDPPPDFQDDEHPLANNYRLLAWVTLEAAWFLPKQRGLAVHLMQREPDREIPEEGQNDA